MRCASASARAPTHGARASVGGHEDHWLKPCTAQARAQDLRSHPSPAQRKRTCDVWVHEQPKPLAAQAHVR
eukprot:12360083-Alexandrium_andersonii.AAC.1